MHADVVKPALIEISISTEGSYEIQIRASIEALLTGINSDYKNTKESPSANKYDSLRVLAPEKLKLKFEHFHNKFLDLINFSIDGSKSMPVIFKVNIPLPGYVKVPRTSTIILKGKIKRNSKQVTWQYPKEFGDNAVRVKQIDLINNKWHWSSWQWLKDNKKSDPFSLTEVFTKATLYEVFKTYTIAGFEHIVPKGLDHILFILGIFLLSIKVKPLLQQVTMFTVAHSITLGLSISGIINLAPNIVEPLIALSIAFIGFENIYHKSLHKSRLLIVFLFGLLHGLGFASVLSEFGMPDEDFFSALISFNLGVEFGQIFIIVFAYISISHWFKNKQWYRSRVIIPLSGLIGLVGLYWTYDRIIF